MAEQDPWAGFADASAAPSADPWAEFDDAPRSKSQRRRDRLRAKRADAPTPPKGDDIVVRPYDGDTLKLASGNSLRLWGADAPELQQQGWNALYQTVPVGLESRNALAGLTSPQSVIGAPEGQSYGRTVAPVTTNGSDVANELVRSGNALAAPSFLASDPQRRYDYVQSERLARQNRLGMHGVYMPQTPAQYRDDPNYQPSREEIAQFWDTPTPSAGLTKEGEQGYLRVVNTGSAEDILAYADAHGFKVDPDEVRDFVSKRDSGAKVPQAVTYRNAPQPLTDLGDGKVGAAMRGVGNGVLPNMLEEVGAIPDTFGLTPGRENVWNSDRRLADIYANNLAQNEAITGFDRSEHPYATFGGELAGSLVVPMGRVRSAADLAKWGAGYGAVSGLGQSGTIPERLTSGVVGAGMGLATTVAGGKALEAAAPYVGKGTRRLLGKGETLPVGSAGTLGETQSAGAGVGGAARADVRAMEAEPEAYLSQAVRRPDYLDMGMQQPARMDQPITEAQRRAMAETVEPRDVVPIASNEVGSVEEATARDAGRYAEAKAPHERGELTKRTVRNFAGQEVPKSGPIDLIGWVRLNGGLRDAGDAVSKGGDLKAMGFTNASRKGLDFVGQEHRFGPLVNDASGMTLDDAALRAWEDGYFPELSDRPDVNTFLEGLRETYNGGPGRRFHLEDQPEIDRFYGAQADRQALERQQEEMGGPVYRDLSVPAGESQPFPPPEAYDDWPSGGPDFAGNIRLDKLDTPQDIKRALDFTDRRVGFDAATRGRVSQAETERLASELGMTPDSLLSRRKGQAFSAEEALAARQILAKSGNELVNLAKRVQSLDEPGDDVLAQFRQAWLRHVAIQEQVSGLTAEAGRALAQFKMAANSRAVRGDVLSAFLRGGGGKDNLRNVADLLLDAAETEPGKFNVLAEKAIKPSWRNKISELYINFLLSWPQTHAVNITSNTLTSLAQIPEHAAASMVGKARQLLPNANLNRITASEVGQRTFGLLQGAKEGAALFARALKSGEASDFVAKVEGQEYKAISGLKGEAVRVPTRLLTAEDEFFKGIARRMEMNGLAARQAHREGLRGKAALQRVAELVSNPSDDLLHAAEQYGRYVTFQAKLGPAAQDISNFANRHLAMKFFLPFVRTPTNLLKFAAERSPAAPLLSEWRADFRAGGARRDLAIAKALVGTGFGAAIYEGAVNGTITGAAPSDPKKARLLYADGWKPYSFKIGDTYYSYRRLDPFSTTIGVAADLATLPEGMSERQKRDKVTLLVASIMGNLANKTWLSGVSDVVGALADPERNADSMVQRLVGSLLVPNVVAGTARTLDPVQRETDTVGDALRSRIPGMRDDLMPRRDIWGEPVTNEGGVGPDFLTPVWVSKALADPVNKALLQLDYAPGYVPKKVGGRELSPEEYDRYSERAGKASHEALAQTIETDAWKTLDDEGKAKLAEKVVTATRRRVREELFGGKVEGKKDAADPWSGFEDAPTGRAVPAKDDPWATFKDPPQRDVMGSLLGIPGLTRDHFTSGYRTPEYQADMRRRGYRPADNSGHLDGSALDIRVPAGRTMGWLMREVKRVEPNARLLAEGDHLHATFPGWYSAPVLGGARSARLVNPMAPPSISRNLTSE